jgi:hypothetical protein
MMERIIKNTKNDGFDIIQTSNPAQLANILRSAISLVYTDYKGAYKFRVILPDKLKVTPAIPIIGEIKKQSIVYSEATDLFGVATIIMNEQIVSAKFPSFVPTQDDKTKLENLCSSMGLSITDTNPLTIEKQ